MLFMLLGGFFFWMCMSSFLPILPNYVKSIGASDGEIGIVMGSFAIGLLLFRPQMGQLVDYRGLKAVLLMGIAVAAIAPLLYAVAQSPALLVAVRIFHGLSIAAFTTSYSTLVADLSPPENRGELIGYMSLVNPIGMGIGPALGGYLQPLIGDIRLFFVCSSIAVISFLFSSAVTVTPRSDVGPLDRRVKTKNNTWTMLRSDRLKIPTLIMVAIGLVFGVLIVYLPLFIKGEGLIMNVGLFYSMAAIASFITRLLSGRASDRLGRGLFITLGLVFYTLAMGLLWRAQSVPMVLAAGFLEGCGAGLVLPMMIVLLTDRCSAQERPRAFSFCIGGFDLGMFLAGPCVGYLANWVGYRGLFAIAMVVALISLLLFMTISSKNLHYSVRFAFGRGRDVYALPNNVGDVIKNT
jgi:MFS family permease